MKQSLDKKGNLTISLFDIQNKESEDKFIYFYLGLNRDVKKIIENAFYTAFTRKLLIKEDLDIIHNQENGVTQIEVHPKDVLANIEIIKRIISDER